VSLPPAFSHTVP